LEKNQVTENQSNYYDFIIVGSGISGISSALALLRGGFKDFLILESAEGAGGVWRENTYPGVACDIPSVVYQFAENQNPNWSKLYAGGEEIMRYLNQTRTKHGLDERTRYGVKVSKAEYDDRNTQWKISTHDGEEYSCRYLIKATGAFNSPLIPKIPHLEDFEGTLFHTARWPKDLDLSGKRVAVLGTGSSAVQLIPIVADAAAQLTVYQRTPIWLLPKFDFNIASPVRWAFKNIPGSYALSRKLSYSGIAYFLQVVLSASGKHPRVHRLLESAGRWNIRRQLKDPALIEKFTPNYNLGCKRPSFSNNYYKAFSKPNVSLVSDGVERLTKDGILRRGAEKADPFDVIILATGFNILGEASTSLPAFPIIGRQGLNLREYWHSSDGFKAFRGATVSGFPNLFLNLGIPYAGGTSWFETADLISEHIVKCVQTAQSRNCVEAEVKSDAVDAYMTEMEKLLDQSVHHTGSCQTSSSYYYDKEGKTPLYSGEAPKESWAKTYSSPEKSYIFRAAPQ
jgi:cation diffusion facilitator CzcD-associated flavoprotein CzcO